MGQIIGAFIITYLLTRLVQWALKKLRVSAPAAAIVAGLIVFAFTLFAWMGAGGPAYAAMLYGPPVLVWLVRDLYLMSKAGRRQSNVQVAPAEPAPAGPHAPNLPPMVPTHDLQTLRETVAWALDRLRSVDRHLLEANLNERTITHRLALYLQDRLNGWHVDCEYNRDGHEPKELTLPPMPERDDDGGIRSVYPDIIVHHRGTTENLLVIEVKKSQSAESDQYDLAKLHGYMQQLGYRYGLFLRVMTGVDAIRPDEQRWLST